MTIDLSKLGLPFPSEDIEWRVRTSGMGKTGPWCKVLPYITARGIMSRLDAVCGPENWKNEEPRVIEVNGKTAFVCGLSIKINDEWITKWNVADPTNIEPAKGGWSGAEKRAGTEWDIARYLYYLDEAYAEVAESPPSKSREWNWAKLPKDQGEGVFYWKAPKLPGWALPKESDCEVSREEVIEFVLAWRAKFAPDITDPKERQEGVTRFVHSIVGEFPITDHMCWTRNALDKCWKRVRETTDPNGVDSDVPFQT